MVTLWDQVSPEKSSPSSRCSADWPAPATIVNLVVLLGRLQREFRHSLTSRMLYDVWPGLSRHRRLCPASPATTRPSTPWPLPCVPAVGHWVTMGGRWSISPRAFTSDLRVGHVVHGRVGRHVVTTGVLHKHPQLHAASSSRRPAARLAPDRPGFHGCMGVILAMTIPAPASSIPSFGLRSSGAASRNRHFLLRRASRGVPATGARASPHSGPHLRE